MKQLIILCAVFLITCTRGFGQQAANYGYNDNYNSYYSPVTHWPSGFRTVDEENRLMNQAIAERRRQRATDDLTEAEMARAVKKHDEEEAAKKRMFAADKKGDPKAKK